MRLPFLVYILVTYYAYKVSANSQSNDSIREDAWLTVPEIIVKYGYPFELHEVTTDDGYILSVHRIPHGRKEGSGPGAGKRVIWLQHGLMGDSSNFIMNTLDKALAYVLADDGYDVWLGNARGNTHSRKHVSLTPHDAKFWDFSWNEMGLHDIPAVLDYILNVTGQSRIYYTGHSMGTTMMYVALSELPQLNDKIRLMNSLAPIAYVSHMKSVARYLVPILNQIEWILAFVGVRELLPSNPLMRYLETKACNEKSAFEGLCENIAFLIAGYDPGQLNRTMLPMIMGHFPAGASTRSLLHYAQCVRSGNFQKYDFGKTKNLELYGQIVPPSYNLSEVTAPVALYWGENDALAAPEDVARTADELGNVVRNYKIELDKYSHLDFIVAKDNDVLLNEPLMKFMEKY